MNVIIEKQHQPKALAVLFNASKPLGLGILHYQASHVMSENEAKSLLSEYNYFDYLEGRVMKLSFEKENVSLGLYDRDNGDNAAINALRRGKIQFAVAED